MEPALVESLIPYIRLPRNPYHNSIPTDKEEQDDLGREMLFWVKNEEVFTIEAFPVSKSMSPTKFFRIGLTNEFFDECIDIATHTIYDRMLKAWRDKKVEKEYVKLLMPLYNEKYRVLMVERHKITENIRQNGGGNVFHIITSPIGGNKSEEKV